jgi:hypothetical protein
MQPPGTGNPRFVPEINQTKIFMETTEKNQTRPTLGSSFSNGWQVMGNNFLYLFLVVIIMSFINAPASLMQFKFNMHEQMFNWNHFRFDHFDPEAFGFLSTAMATLGALALILAAFAFAYTLLVKPIFEYGSDMIFVQAARKIKPDFNKLIIGFKENYFQIILANLLTSALVLMGFFACIIPGIIIACRLVFVSYLVMDKKLDPIAAVEESWRMTRGYGWTVFFMGLLSGLIIIAGLMLCIVGIYPAIVWVGSSFASLYESILLTKVPIVNPIQEIPVS